MERVHLCDPFAAAFAEAISSAPSKRAEAGGPSPGLLTTEKQWRAFVNNLKESGLYSEPDAMEDIWAELVRQGKLYQPEGKVRIQLSFERWREMLIKRVGSNTEGLDSSLLGIRQHAKVLDDIVSGWDMEGMSAEETRRLLLILSVMDDRRTALRTGLATRCEGDAYHVLLQATWTLLTEREGEAVASEVDKRAVGAVNNPFRWQFQHMEQIERMGRLRRPRKVRFRTTRRSGPRGEPVRDDVYGVAQGLNGQYGIRVYRGTCEVKEAEGKEREVLVVAVPATAPHEAACAQVNAYMAHRELALSGGVLHCLGKDWAASDEALYYYDYAPGVTLQSLLRPERGEAVVLQEGGLLFRYWAGQILRALSDLQAQACHVLHNRRLGLQNVVVSGKGLRVRLGGLEWGPKISAYRDVSAEELRGRMRGLMRDFSAIVLEMLGLNSHSCWHGWFRNMGHVLGPGGMDTYDHRRALDGVEVGEGDQVVVNLEAQHQRMYKGFEVLPLDGKLAESSGEPVVAVTWDEADTPIAQDVQTMRVRGLRAGACQIVVRFQDLEASHDQGSDGSVRIVVTVTPVRVSPRLKAVLRSCQIASGTGSALDLQEGAAKMYMGQGKWRDRFSKFWIQDFLANPYFAKMSDAHLDEVIAEYEALFETQVDRVEDGDDEDQARYLRAVNNADDARHE